MQTYRIQFEMVKPSELHKYCNADPTYYKNVTQTVPNSQIPDEDWYEVTSRASYTPWEQYDNLRRWADQDIEFVRNVRLEKMVAEPQWTPCDPEQERNQNG